MDQLYIANKTYSSWSLRPWVLMTELGLPFDERLVPFGSGSNREAFRRFSPTGQVPCLVTDDGQTLWESLAIVEFLAERQPAVWPADAQARAWARCAAAEMHAGFQSLRSQCPMTCAWRVRLRGVDAALQRDLDRLDELWGEGLARFEGPFLAGDRFTAVDAFFCPVAIRVQSYGLTLGEAAAAYVQRLLALPAMRRWVAEALAEPWIEPGHEADCLRGGELLADLRPPRPSLPQA
ncbi:MAG: glutathione S-transferase family protein [Rubrivivax sp.]|nr:MAG: glutathione S-transferase family protein [Rubrivivax sp.]